MAVTPFPKFHSKLVIVPSLSEEAAAFTTTASGELPDEGVTVKLAVGATLAGGGGGGGAGGGVEPEPPPPPHAERIVARKVTRKVAWTDLAIRLIPNDRPKVRPIRCMAPVSGQLWIVPSVAQGRGSLRDRLGRAKGV